MVLRKLALSNFRNYSQVETELSDSLNVIYGLNAQGKTNFLEAIYLLCLGRSFRLARSQEMLQYEAQSFLVNGAFVQNNELEKEVTLSYKQGGKKEISINRKRLASHSRLFGQLPVVIMAPDEFRITAGAPAERRRFLDILLSQVSLSYLTDLQEYNRVLKHRNKILQNIRHGTNVPDAAIQPWTESLIKAGSQIIARRDRFIAEFRHKLDRTYRSFAPAGAILDVLIDSTVPYINEGTVSDAYTTRLNEMHEKERILGMTLVGPHRDDLVFTIDGADLRKFGSRGEHKSVLFCVKMAEFTYLKEKRQETPIMLLDDCYSELDNQRERSIFDSLPETSQIFMTSPRETILADSNRISEKTASGFIVGDGKIERIQN